MTQITFADALETASEQVGSTPDEEVATLLRSAAIRLRNSSTVILDADVDYSLSELALEFRLSKDQLIRNILREWVEERYTDFAYGTVQ
jgi:hypothetical protein